MAELVARLSATLSQIPHVIEVLLIDDGSTDRTREYLSKAVANAAFRDKFRCLALAERVGQARALKQGIDAAEYSRVIRMDGDLQDHPEDIMKFVEQMAAGHDLVVGLRAARSHSRLERFQSSLFNTFAILLLDSPLHSSVGSFVAFEKELLANERFGTQTNRWMVLLALRNGCSNPTEIFVNHSPRNAGLSKYSPARKTITASYGALLFLLKESILKATRRASRKALVETRERKRGISLNAQGG